MNLYNKYSFEWVSCQEDTQHICCFQHSFEVSKKVKEATLYISGLGFYEATINGIGFDNHYFKPNVSDYKKRNDPLIVKKDIYFAYYDTYTIANLLKETNTLMVYVGPGYFHNKEKLDAPNYDYGRTRLFYVLDITYLDGSNELISSGEETKAAISNSSSRLFKGDYFDFSNTNLKFKKAKIIKERIELKESKFGGDIIDKIYEPNLINESSNSKIFDFGVNHTGGIKAKIKGVKGSKVVVKYGEFLNNDGTINFLSSSYSDFKPDEFVPPFTTCKA
ncbi:MAG: family 78 glycoside hydrolase catalytic domain, partial [Bacilli bacterium]|nr:family 78 glycoside hydrolase catalytic domain [Bacilli bacterium]